MKGSSQSHTDKIKDIGEMYVTNASSSVGVTESNVPLMSFPRWKLHLRSAAEGEGLTENHPHALGRAPNLRGAHLRKTLLSSLPVLCLPQGDAFQRRPIPSRFFWTRLLKEAHVCGFARSSRNCSRISFACSSCQTRAVSRAFVDLDQLRAPQAQIRVPWKGPLNAGTETIQHFQSAPWRCTVLNHWPSGLVKLQGIPTSTRLSSTRASQARRAMFQAGSLCRATARPRPRHRRMGSITRHRPSSIRSLELSARHMVICFQYVCMCVLPDLERATSRRLPLAVRSDGWAVLHRGFVRWFSATPTPLQDVGVPPHHTRKHGGGSFYFRLGGALLPNRCFARFLCLRLSAIQRFHLRQP